MIASKSYVVQKMEELKIRANKRYGQNFLIDPKTANAIVSSLKINVDDQILEIGPGFGALTEILSQHRSPVYAVEIDQTMVGVLKETFIDSENVTIIHQDFLKTKIDHQITKIIGNLPYYITSPIIEKALLEGTAVSLFVFMVQKEAALRLLAKPGHKDYGPLNILIELMGEMKIINHVPCHSFFPMPHVESSVLQIQVVENLSIDKRDFYNFLRKAFAHRRKTLVNNLLPYYFKEKIINALETNGLSSAIRPENVTLKQFLKIYSALS